MGRKVIFMLIVFCHFGCADFELHVRKDSGTSGVSVFLLCPFEVRSMNYDPYISDEFIDSLKYELFCRGRDSVVLPKSVTVSGSESAWAAKTCGEYSGDILIKGVISQRETGFFSDRSISTVISFIIYNRKGGIIGEGFYHDDQPAGDNSVKKDAARKLVSSLLEKLDRVN